MKPSSVLRYSRLFSFSTIHCLTAGLSLLLLACNSKPLTSPGSAPTTSAGSEASIAGNPPAASDTQDTQQEGFNGTTRLRKECERSGARFDPTLFACICPKFDEVFVAELGCRPLSYSEQTENCVKDYRTGPFSADCLW